MEFCPDGKTSADFITSDSIIRFWDIASGKQIGTIKCNGHPQNVLLCNDGKLVIAVTNDEVEFWNYSNKRAYPSIKEHSKVKKVSLNNSGKTITIVNENDSVYLWDFISHEQIANFKSDIDVIYTSLSPDEKLIVNSSKDGKIQLYNIATHKKDNITIPHSELARCKTSFSPDGTKILAVSGTNAIVLNLNMQQVLPEIKHDGVINTAVFSNDGRMILTSSQDGTTRLWDVTTGLQIGKTMYHDNWAIMSTFSPTDEKVLIGYIDAVAKIWNIGADFDISPEFFKLQAEVISGVEFNEFTNTTQCLSLEKWYKLKAEYYREGKRHLEHCKYNYNNLLNQYLTY
jgi:WD40 repeat protein